jgi:hypothetical protein
MIIIQFKITNINDPDCMIFQDYDHPSMITITTMVWNGINDGPICPTCIGFNCMFGVKNFILRNKKIAC